MELQKTDQLYGMDRQERFLEFYLNPSSPTFMKTEKSALRAGYSETNAKNLSSPSFYRKNYKKIANTLDQIKSQMSQKMSPEVVLERLDRALDFLEGLMENPEELKQYRNFAKLADYIRILELHGKFLRMWSEDDSQRAGTFKLILNAPPEIENCPHCGKRWNDKPKEIEVEAEAEKATNN